MNFYKHHIGDYAAATAHLSILEDGVYSRLLRIYYRDEKPLPVEVKAVQRLVMARSRDEREAVQTMLEEFFELQDDGWHNKRADEELAVAAELEEAKAEKRNNEAERQRRHRERRKVLFEELRKHDIVPKFDTSTDALEAMLSRVTGGDGHANVTQTDGATGVTGHALATANQTPDTRHQTPDKSKSTSSHAESPKPEPTAAGRACRLMREAGCASTNPSHPDLLAALAEGVTPEQLADTAREGLTRTPRVGKPFAWAIATARSRLAEGAQPITPGARHDSPRRSAADRVADNVRRRHEQQRDPIDGEAERLAR